MGPDIRTFNFAKGMTSTCTASPLTGGPRQENSACSSGLHITMAGVGAGCCGCACRLYRGPDYKRPEVVVPTNWRNGSVGESITNLGWWQLFEDSTLQE